jgi:hypothetical protein
LNLGKELGVWDYAQLGFGGLIGGGVAFAAWFIKLIICGFYGLFIGSASFRFGAGLDGVTAAASGVGAYLVEQPFFRGLLGGLTVGEVLSAIHMAYLGFLEPYEARVATRATLKALGVEASEQVLKMQEMALEKARAEVLKHEKPQGRYMIVD